MKAKKISLAIIVIALIVLFDQYTKYLVVKNMQPYSDEKKIVGDALVLYYVKNTGAAWSVFSKNTGFLIGLSVFIIVFLIGLFIKNIDREDRKMMRLFTILTIGGAVGNLIDRVRLGFVVDFIFAKFINFPVFNVADIFVTISAFALVILFFFVYKDDEEDTNKKDKNVTNETENDTNDKSEKFDENTSEDEPEEDK